MTVHTPDVRWADPGLNRVAQLYCHCGEFAIEFMPAQQPGEELPLSLALEKFREHREEATRGSLPDVHL